MKDGAETKRLVKALESRGFINRVIAFITLFAATVVVFVPALTAFEIDLGPLNAKPLMPPDECIKVIRNGPRKLDSAVSEILM